jgi:hypothetical protein
VTSSRDSGQIGVLVVAAAAACLAVVQGMVRFGDALVDSARAQSVADAIALAVAAGRPDVVDRVIDDHEEVVVKVEESGEADDVTVRVSVNGREADARAATTP